MGRSRKLAVAEDTRLAGAVYRSGSHRKMGSQRRLRGIHRSFTCLGNREPFGITVRQIKNFTEKDLKKALARHQVVLLPINARLLGNTTYATTGPFYHMIVVRGYTPDGFIVNDPGTERGNSMRYSFDTLQKAAADWNHSAKTMDLTIIKIALVLSNSNGR